MDVKHAAILGAVYLGCFSPFLAVAKDEENTVATQQASPKPITTAAKPAPQPQAKPIEDLEKYASRLASQEKVLQRQWQSLLDIQLRKYDTETEPAQLEEDIAELNKLSSVLSNQLKAVRAQRTKLLATREQLQPQASAAPENRVASGADIATDGLMRLQAEQEKLLDEMSRQNGLQVALLETQLSLALRLLLAEPELQSEQTAQTDGSATEAADDTNDSDFTEDPFISIMPRPGRLSMTPTLSYSHSSSGRIAISGFTIIPSLNVGAFDIREVNRDTITNVFSFRYGLNKRTELGFSLPYVFRYDYTRTRPIGEGTQDERIFSTTGQDLGDLEVSLSYQLDGIPPFFIGRVSLKSDTGRSPYQVAYDPDSNLPTEPVTGSGFWALQSGISMIMPSDPVVINGGLTYVKNFGRGDLRNSEGRRVGDIEPGDAVGFSLGLGLSLNTLTSMNFGFSHRTVLNSKLNGILTSEIAQVSMLSLGVSYRYKPTDTLSFSVATGLTEDAPDVTFSFSKPFTLNRGQ